MEKIHVLHIGLDSHLGGIETYLKKISTYIDKDKFQFDFLGYKGIEPCYYKELKELGCNFYFIHSRRQNFLKNRKDLNKLFSENKFDIVHCHLNTLSFSTPIKIAIRNKINVIAHSHNSLFVGKKISKIMHKYNYLVLPRKKIHMVAVSDFAGKWMFGKRAKFIVLNNGIDISKFQYSEKNREKIRKEFQIGNERLIVHTGAFRSQKNHDFIIDIFNSLLKYEQKSKLLLVGDGVLKQKIIDKTLKLNINNNVIFAGIRNDIPDILSAGDCFLFPSLYEGFPNSLIEAEASGLYCIASDTITKQAKIEGICQYLSLDKSPEEWAMAIHNSENVKNRDNVKEKIIEKKLDINSEIDRLETLYKKIMEDNK